MSFETVKLGFKPIERNKAKLVRRNFKVIDIVEIFEHWYSGRSILTMTSSLGLDAKTIRKYLTVAKDQGIVPGGERIDRSYWVELANRSFPEITDANARSKTFPSIDIYHDAIEEMIQNNKIATIYQRLRDENGLAVGITSFRKYISEQFPDQSQRNKATVLRPVYIAGDEAQIDYGYMGKFYDPVLQKIRRLWVFVMILTYSRYMFVAPVMNLDSYSWIKCHIAAFEFFGGVPKRLVIDNLKTGVSKPDLYDPKINRSYQEM
ncbi:Integrase catalytic region, partial [mine drainage metagenome]